MLKVRLLVLWCCSLFFLGQNPSVSRAAPGPAGQPAARIKQLRTLAAEQSHTDPALARTTLEQALALARQSHDAQAERGILNDLADVCGRLTELADAQRCINAARRLATQAQDTLELGRAYLFSAMVAEGDTIRQLRFAELAVQQLVLVPRAGNWLLRAQTELATDYLKARKLAAAKQVFRQAQRVSRQLGEAGPEFRLLINWAPGIQTFEPDSAARLLQRARYLADTQLRTPYPRAYVRNAQANLALQQHHWVDVIAFSNEALQLGRQAKTPDIEAQALVQLAEALRQLGQARAAYDTLQHANQLFSALEVENKRGELNRLQVRFDVERQQARIQGLEQQRRLAELQAERERIRTYGLLGGLLGFGLLSALLLRSRRRLQQSETQLRTANQTKDQLMHIIGHDLRGPLAGLQQFVPLLHEVIEQPERAAAHQLITTLDAGAQHVGGLVDNLFQWTRAQSNQLVNHAEHLRAEAAVASIAALYAPAALLKHLTLTTEVAPPALLVWADLGLLTTVLRNLVGNALKFTPTGGTVHLEARALDMRAVEFSVTDTGQGIRPEQIQQLLTHDHLVSTPGTNGEPGTGLGLPLSARFVRLLGGELHIEPQPDGGTRCWFRVPARGNRT